MFGIGRRKAVGAVEGRVGAEIQVIVVLGVENGFQAAFRRAGDRARGQAGVLVGIVGRVDFQVTCQDAVQAVAVAVGDGRIGLEEHPDPETVQVYAGNRGLFGPILGLPVHDGGEGGHPHGSKPLLAGQFQKIIKIECKFNI